MIKGVLMAWYGLGMVGALAFAWINTVILSLLTMLGLVSRRFVGGWTILALSLGWNLNMWCCPWIKTRKTERFHTNFAILGQQQREFVAMERPDDEGSNIVLLCNHTSFLDTPQYTRLVPRSILWHCRGYVGAFLFKMPLFGRVLQGIGHFAVHFKSTEEGKFSVDKEKMAEVEEGVDAHLAAKGVLCLFPEGCVNKAPEKGLLPFRYGTFVKALKHDFCLWGYTSVNHEKSWPKAASIGGLPAELVVDLWPLAPKGVKQLVKEIRANDLVDGCKEKEDHVILAEYAHATMQKEVNQLRAGASGSKKQN